MSMIHAAGQREYLWAAFQNYVHETSTESKARQYFVLKAHSSINWHSFSLLKEQA